MDDTAGGHSSYVREDNNEEPPREQNVLVLTDFSEKVHAALTYAATFVKASKGKILLLHVAQPQENDRSLDLSKLVTEYREAVECNWLLSQGDFLTEVSAAVRDFHTAMVVIGSQHLNTPELYKKSMARTLFKHLAGAYLLVQSEIDNKHPFQRILLPVDYSDKPDCKHSWLNLFVERFPIEVHLILPQVNETELQETVEANLEKILALLDAKAIPHLEYTVEGREDFSQEILAYAHQIEADLLVINSMRTPENLYLLESHERSLIVHAAELPVLVVNA